MPRAALIRPLRLRCAAGGEPGRKVTWLELFFDLVFVAAVAQVGTPLTSDYSPVGLLRYAFLFLLIWWAWNGHTIFLNRFDTDDLVQRALTLVQMFAVAAMAVNAKEGLDSRSSAGFAAAYGAMRFVLVAQYIRARQVREARELTTRYAVGFGVAAVLWLVSSLVPTPARFWLWAMALVIDIGTPLATVRHTIKVPPDTAHLPERFGLFTIILLGESMVAVMKGMETQNDWSLAAGLSAFLGMCLGFLLWWWYFDGADGAGERVIRSRNQATRFQIWSYAHLPLYLGIAVTGVGVEHIISVATKSHLHAEEAWILCGALAIVMAAMTTIAAMSEPAEREPSLWRSMAPHYGVAAVTLCVGAIGDHVPSAVLVALLTILALIQVVISARPLTRVSARTAAMAIENDGLQSTSR